MRQNEGQDTEGERESVQGGIARAHNVNKTPVVSRKYHATSGVTSNAGHPEADNQNTSLRMRLGLATGTKSLRRSQQTKAACTLLAK